VLIGCAVSLLFDVLELEAKVCHLFGTGAVDLPQVDKLHSAHACAVSLLAVPLLLRVLLLACTALQRHG
jgi:hypothetical protein